MTDIDEREESPFELRGDSDRESVGLRPGTDQQPFVRAKTGREAFAVTPATVDGQIELKAGNALAPYDMVRTDAQREAGGRFEHRDEVAAVSRVRRRDDRSA